MNTQGENCILKIDQYIILEVWTFILIYNTALQNIGNKKKKKNCLPKEKQIDFLMCRLQ